jgi:hypothetical protein
MHIPLQGRTLTSFSIKGFLDVTKHGPSFVLLALPSVALSWA